MIRFALTLAVLAGAADAQSVKLSADEIATLLTGNTAVGTWEGNAYRQYFDADGSTIYAQEGARSARGSWRVEGEEYQSIWASDTEWEGWLVMEYAGQWFWVSKITPPTPFDVVEGQELVVQ
ncbi:MAG: hypothetical protein ABJF86_08965 [Tateyamaria sp.]|uniref:hypothetical protein n=1 Tax=Tateyamaria sp. TaxID=1929288 RepID=UPI00328BC704